MAILGQVGKWVAADLWRADKPCRPSGVQKNVCSLPFPGWYLFSVESLLCLPMGVPPWGWRGHCYGPTMVIGRDGRYFLAIYHWDNCGDFKNKCFLLTLSHADVEVGHVGDSAPVPTLQLWQAASSLRPHGARVLALETMMGRPEYCRPLGTACPLMEMGPSQESWQCRVRCLQLAQPEGQA